VLIGGGTIRSRMAESDDAPARAGRPFSLRALRRPPTVRLGMEIGVGLVGLVIAAILLWWTAQVLLVFFAALFLAVFFNGLGRALEKRSSFSYPFCLAFALLGLTAIIVLAGLIIGPAVSDQSANLSQALPKAYHQLIDKAKTLPGGASAVAALKQTLHSSQGNSLESAVKFAGVTLHGFGGMIFAVIIGIFFAADPKLYRGGFLALIPRRKRARMGEVLDELGFTLWWWLMGQLATMASVGILIGAGLTLLHVPLSGTLGLIAAVLSFIPSLGPLISVIPAIMLGLTISPMMGVWVALLYLGVQTLESNVITPLIQHRAISLPPAFVLASELIMGVLLGGAGLAFATPLAAVILVLVNMLYIEDYLKEKGSLPSDGRGKEKSKPARATTSG
jgi:predicted PurR-regulated permease PerM